MASTFPLQAFHLAAAKLGRSASPSQAAPRPRGPPTRRARGRRRRTSAGCATCAWGPRQAHRQDRPRAAPLRGARPARAGAALERRLPPVQPRLRAARALDRQAAADGLLAHRHQADRQRRRAEQERARCDAARRRTCSARSSTKRASSCDDCTALESELKASLDYLETCDTCDTEELLGACTDCARHDCEHKTPDLVAGFRVH